MVRVRQIYVYFIIKYLFIVLQANFYYYVSFSEFITPVYYQIVQMCSSLVWGLSAPIIAIFMGIAGIVVSAHMYSQTDYSYILTINSQYVSVVLLTVFSVLSLFAGALGICAVFQYSKSNITCFWISMFICLIGFCAGAAVGLVIPFQFERQGCLGTSYASIIYINNQTVEAQNRFCKNLITNNCTCYFDNRTSIFNDLNTKFPGGGANNYTLPISVFDCPNWIVGNYDRTLASLQNEFNCAGWCNPSQIYLFSNVNKGFPSRTCFSALSSWFKQYSQTAYITCFIFIGICLVLIIWVCVYQYLCVKQDIQYFKQMSMQIY